MSQTVEACSYRLLHVVSTKGASAARHVIMHILCMCLSRSNANGDVGRAQSAQPKMWEFGVLMWDSRMSCVFVGIQAKIGMVGNYGCVAWCGVE